MTTNLQIQDLIEMPKIIVSRTQSQGYKEEGSQRRCNLQLEAIGNPSARFHVFIRQHIDFIENFSIGLRYRTGNKRLPIVTLIRYNGAHGEYDISPDGHYARAHIHRITEAELLSGSIQPQERHRGLRTDIVLLSKPSWFSSLTCQ